MARVLGAPRDPSRLRRGRALTAVVVLEADDVVRLGGGHLDQLTGLERLETMAPPGRHMTMLARPQVYGLDRPVLVLEMEAEPARDDVDRFVLALVVLE